jgi:hypothetical protein
MNEYEVQNVKTKEIFLIYGYSWLDAMVRHNMKGEYKCLAMYKEDEE